jgi:preprotein translocase subunit SecB
MLQPNCHLDEFFMTRVNVAWHEPAEPGSVDIDFLFDYDVLRHTSEKNRFRLAFRLAAKSKTPAPVDYSLDTEIVGFFHFSEDSSEETMQSLVRFNGCTILYGILRGQLANITGSFPHQKLLLPTVMMENVVTDIEREKAQGRQENPPIKKKTAKKAAKRPKAPAKKK